MYPLRPITSVNLSPGGVHVDYSESLASSTMKAKLLLNTSSTKGLLTIFILTLAWAVGFCSRLFSVIRFESIIHEFDPWFNYRATKQMVDNNFYDFLNWFDTTAWYPLGRIVGGTVYPGLMVTSGRPSQYHPINCDRNASFRIA